MGEFVTAVCWCAIGVLIGFAVRDIKDAYFYRHRLTQLPAEVAKLRVLILELKTAIDTRFG